MEKYLGSFEVQVKQKSVAITAASDSSGLNPFDMSLVSVQVESVISLPLSVDNIIFQSYILRIVWGEGRIFAIMMTWGMHIWLPSSPGDESVYAASSPKLFRNLGCN
ncbi:hypothetical protein CEXT_247201 [Caerostris extrusa]|uniref:Uncharacterized protein n=1 Tax=Caerostris extrusa TaxID=172846 RepID=A0AAV4WYF0_CAEEX|nr:hypothetical protein CEXT_247201 [Caerostris extrusa]